MSIEVKRVGDEWAAFDPSVPSTPLVTGKTFGGCLQNLQQLLNSSDRVQTLLGTSGRICENSLRFIRRNLISALRAVRTMP